VAVGGLKYKIVDDDELMLSLKIVFLSIQGFLNQCCVQKLMQRFPVPLEKISTGDIFICFSPTSFHNNISCRNLLNRTAMIHNNSFENSV